MKTKEERLQQLVDRKNNAIDKFMIMVPGDITTEMVKRIADVLINDDKAAMEFDRYCRTVKTIDREADAATFDENVAKLTDNESKAIISWIKGHAITNRTADADRTARDLCDAFPTYQIIAAAQSLGSNLPNGESFALEYARFIVDGVQS